MVVPCEKHTSQREEMKHHDADEPMFCPWNLRKNCASIIYTPEEIFRKKVHGFK